jgi:hypothetical protein
MLTIASILTSLLLLIVYTLPDKRVNTIVLWIIAVGLFSLITFRGEFGDYTEYKDFYNNSNELDFTRFEVGWVLINTWFKSYELDFVYLISSFIRT